MKCTSLILFFSLIVVSALTQNLHLIDSLKEVLSRSKEDTNKVNLYADLSFKYQWSYPDSALSYSLPGLQLARKLHFEKGEIDVLLTMGEALAMKGNYSKALEIKLEALQIAEKLNSYKNIENSFIGIGGVYYYSGDYLKALYYFQKQQAGKYIFADDPELILVFIGETYFHLNKLDSALIYIRKAYDLDVLRSTHSSNPYFYMAAIQAKKEKYKEALDYYRVSINVPNPEIVDLIMGYNGMAAAFNKSGIIDSAIYYAKKAITAGQNGSFASEVIEASALLTEIYTTKHITDSALKYQGIMLAGKDSLFSQEKVRQMQNLSFNEQLRQQEIETEREQFRNKLKMYALLAALFVFLIIGFLLWRNNRHKQKAYALLQKQKQEIDTQKAKAEQSLQELKSTQSRLIQSEKMASLGELTAGIAHEIQNPLNFVNNFSEVNTELIDELEQEAGKGNLDEVKAIAKDIKENEEKINHHGKRADAIVKGMLQHSRTSSGQKELTDLNVLADEYLRLAYHGLRAKDKSFNAKYETDFDSAIGKINIVPQEIGRVILNLINNAFYAVTEKKKSTYAEASADKQYEPTVTISTRKWNDKIEIKVKDNGNGIPQKVMDKIFQPFFTTKPTGQGTGLGLSLSYDIIKAHGGELKVETEEEEFAEFIIQLPTG